MRQIMRTGARRLAGVCVLLAVAGVAASGAMAQDPAGATIRPVVVDSATGAPLAAVEVRVAGRVLETDAAGRFTMPATPGGGMVELRRLGYAPARLPAAALPATIRLRPRPVLLDALAVESGSPNRLARGTALTVGTVQGEALHAGGHTTVAEALDGLEGVSVSRMGSWGSRPVVRGLSGERVAILVNGNRVARACAFGMDQGLATVDPATVERVEVVAGPGTALYGSGSVGGVINVVTSGSAARAPRADGVTGEARARAATGSSGGSAGATVRLDRSPLAIGLSLDGTSHGDYRTPEGTVDGSGFDQATAELTAAYTPAPGRELALRLQAFEGRDIGWPAMAGAEIPRESRRAASLDYGHQRGTGWLDGWAARGWIQRLDHEMEVAMRMGTDPVMTSVTRQRSHSTTGGGRLQARLVPHARVHVDAGVEATGWWAEATRATERTMGQMPPTELSLHTWPAVDLLDLGAFAQGQLRIGGGVAVSGGLRLDRVERSADGWPSTDENVRSGNLGVSARLPAGLGARASVGWGYRTPDPTELFGLALRPDGFIHRGNPELATETGRNLEAGLTLDAGAVSGAVTVFRNDLDDLIAPVPSPGDSVAGHPVRTYANVAEARITGWSASATWHATRWLGVRGNATGTRGEDRRTDEPLPATPPLEGALAFRVTPGAGGAWVEAEGRGAAEQTRNVASLGEPGTPAWLVVDLSAGARLAGAEWTVGVGNVLDTAYRAHLDPVRLLRTGRSLWVGARVGW